MTDSTKLSATALLRRQTHPYFRALLARWARAQEDPDRIRGLLEQTREMKQEGGLSGPHDSKVIFETVAAHTQLVEDEDLVAELLGEHRAQRGIVANVHHTPGSRRRIAAGCIAVLEGGAFPTSRDSKLASGWISASSAARALQGLMEEGWPLPEEMRERLLAIVEGRPRPISVSRFAAEDHRTLAFHLLVACPDLSTEEVQRLWHYVAGPKAIPADSLITHPSAGPSIWRRFVREMQQWSRENDREISESDVRPLLETRGAWSLPEVRSFIGRYGKRGDRKEILAHQTAEERRDTIARIFEDDEVRSLREVARGELTPEGDELRAEDLTRTLTVVSEKTRSELVSLMAGLKPVEPRRDGEKPTVWI